MDLLLSIFTGAGLFDRGFEQAGFCVVSAGDIFYGRDIRRFHSTPGKFKGVFGGSPCQEFSKARRAAPIKPYACDVATRTAYGFGVAMLREFERVVLESDSDWFLSENVPGVPDVRVPGYTVQRFNLNARELGLLQNRPRCFQFGSKDGVALVIPRRETLDESHRCVMASDGERGGLSFPKACELQGLGRNFSFPPGLSRIMQMRLVGNGVPVPLAFALACAIRDRHVTKFVERCVCGCGHPVRRGVTLATQACRKRMSRRGAAASHVAPVALEFDL